MTAYDRRYFYSSEYRTARKPHVCQCGQVIKPSLLYLFFVPREREHIDVCLACSVKRHPDRSFVWPCNAVRERIEQLGDQAGEQAQASLPLTGFDDDELPEES